MQYFGSLYSGSGGNSVLVSAAGTSVLIDAGKSARALCAALCAVGSDISQISAIFVTHEHTDHVSALEMISKKYRIPVHMTASSAANMPVGEFLDGVLVRHPPLFVEKIGGLCVSSFMTSHDSACSVGYRIGFSDDGEEHFWGIATDTGYVTRDMEKELSGCEAVVIESNHDREMLDFGSYPPTLKARIRSRRGHLANDDCAAFAAVLSGRGTRSILLAHLSRENNRPDVAYSAVCPALPENVKLLVADAECPTGLIGGNA